jgi:exosortase C (VPDSG-CTERM-specific)
MYSARVQETLNAPRCFAYALGALALLFAVPLFEVTRFALKTTTFSHVVLVPFIVTYLASLHWKSAIQQCRPSTVPAVVCLAIGVLIIGTNWLFVRTTEMRMSLWALSFVLFTLAVAFRFLGTAVVRKLAFPFAMLVFMVPLPPVIMDALEIFFQHASAFAAAGMIRLSGLPAIQDGLFFFLPGFAIQVAQECSGIRSTLVLFITSLIAGYLLLRRPRDRAILVAAIIPLAILRNGFRIFSLAWLSVEVNPNIIDSALHHQGGPIYFALSLIPLFLLLLFLRKLEKKHVYPS